MESNQSPTETPAIMAAQTLYVVYGPPGVGKSTVASYLSDTIDTEWLRTDEIRHEQFTDPAYSPEETALVYNELLDRARSELEAGRSVVCDGTFSASQYRARAYGLAQLTDSQYTGLLVWCDENTVEDRIRDRDGVSDADFVVHKSLKRDFDTIEQPYTMIDNSGSREKTYVQIDTQCLSETDLSS